MKMDETYKFALNRYFEKNTNLEKPYIMILDKNGLLEGIEDIDISLYPHKIITVESNVLFRAGYEDLKHKHDIRYIIVLKKEELKDKLKDFTARSEHIKVLDITLTDVLNNMEDGVHWNNRINDYSVEDLKKCFSNLIYYRKKSYPKKNINSNETDKIVLSAIYDIDASTLSDAADCYIYYKNILSVYANPNLHGYKANLIKLLATCFKNNGGEIIGSLTEKGSFDYLDKVIWICYVLKDLGKLNPTNVKLIFSEQYRDDLKLDKYYGDFAYLASIIEKKDKKLFIDMKDKGEKWVVGSNIGLKVNDKDYLAMVMENAGSYIHVTEGLKQILCNINLEGLPKVYKYSLMDLKKLLYEINNVSGPTQSIKNVTKFISDLIELIDKIEILENIDKNIKTFKFNDWNDFYKKYLFDLQYKLQEIMHLDKEGFISDAICKGIDNRINHTLNNFRKNFALYLKQNYNLWQGSNYTSERPLMNSDIGKYIDTSNKKIFLIVFDGMRLDAFHYIVKRHFQELLDSRDTDYKLSYSLLPSITEISRTVLYKELLKDNKDDAVYITKSESVQKSDELKELLLKDKSINIIVYDMFDRDGHKAVEDFYLFYNKQEKIFESKIKELISQIPDDTDVIIASDHGLMRIDEYQSVGEYEGITDVKYRYLTADFTQAADYYIGIKDSVMINNLILSYSNIGYYKGGGDKDLYSHGGCSPEEVIVPFVYSKHRKGKKDGSIVSGVQEGLSYVNYEYIVLSDGRTMTLPLKLSEIEKLIISSVYRYKAAGITNKDLEILIFNRFKRGVMVDGTINRLNKKLQSANIPKIVASAAGDILVYRLPVDEYEGGGYIEQ